MRAFFITGVGTSVGKTFVSAALLRQLRATGETPFALKPVVTGFLENDETGDPFQLMKALGIKSNQDTLATISPWRYINPLSPDQSVRMEGPPIDTQALVDHCRATIARHSLTLVEGIGGAFTPVTRNFLVADWIAALDIPFLLVAGNYLGTLSHTLATLEALRARRMKPKAVIVSQTTDALDHPVSLSENVASLLSHLKDTVVVSLPYQSHATEAVEMTTLVHLLT